MSERLIKFRAWDTKTGKGMSEPFEIGDIAQGYDCNYNVDFPFDVAYESILMQYTGLKDKNGVEIYEGDLIRGHNEENGNEFVVECKYVGENSSGLGGCFRFNGWLWNDLPQVSGSFTMLEVIGNVHENPELLNGSDAQELKQ